MKWPWIVILVGLALPGAVPRETHRDKPTPRIYGDRVPTKMIRIGNGKVRQKIVEVHNYLRSKVNPPAANMLAMKWHPSLAKAAQRWANRCQGLRHDNATGLYMDNFGKTGQNIFITTGRTLWNFPIRMWYQEYKDFIYGPEASNDILEVGHYTQLVWATTHLVGCGISHCTNGRGPLGRDYYIYVCNYAPSGNRGDRLGLPYVAGEPCGMCANACSSSSSGNGKLCTNGCDYADLWSNCADLRAVFRGWLCDSAGREGRERRKFCAATCNCNGRIY